MLTEPSLCIGFDSTNWKPMEIFINGRTDEETARLEEIADKIIEAVKESDQ